MVQLHGVAPNLVLMAVLLEEMENIPVVQGLYTGGLKI